MRRAHAGLLIAAAAALPRLAVLSAERGQILASFTEKSDDLARTLVASGTFGYVPGHPSAYTQPLYGFFLAGIYAVLGRHWLAVGLVQILVACASAVVVHELARRLLGPRVGLAAALVAAVNPYLVWHDVHVNRELLDTLVAALAALGILLAWERRSWRSAGALGVVLGLGVLGNTRLAALPALVTLAFLLPRPGRRGLAAAVAVLVGAALPVVPWVVRNDLEVGCAAITTDARALWKANNLATHAVLADGGRWIDDVPAPPGSPPTPEQAAAAFAAAGTPYRVDECAQMRHFQHLVLVFWREHPGEKARLAAQAATMLWQPRAVETAGGPSSRGAVAAIKRWAEPLYLVPLYALALLGAFVVPRRLAVLAVGLLGYQTLAALVFAGATRYRAPWDFLVATLAAGGGAYALERIGRARRAAAAPQRS